MKIKIIAWLGCCALLASCGTPAEDEKSLKQNDNHSQKNMGAQVTQVQDGPYKEFYPGGELKIEGTISDGKKEGEWKSFYASGGNYSVNNFAGGILNGKTVTYFENGQIRYIGYYTNGKPSGKWLIFNDKGEQIQEKEYK